MGRLRTDTEVLHGTEAASVASKLKQAVEGAQQSKARGELSRHMAGVVRIIFRVCLCLAAARALSPAQLDLNCWIKAINQFPDYPSLIMIASNVQHQHLQTAQQPKNKAAQPLASKIHPQQSAAASREVWACRNGAWLCLSQTCQLSDPA
eukprot:1161829-Pelagomonas_calceolata.AAC.12